MRSMQKSALGRARWFEHVNAVNPPKPIRDWLTEKGSLTTRLIRQCGQFRVQPLRQRRASCLSDEYATIDLPRRLQVWERDVVLRCDENAVVYAHTVVPLRATASDWPFFRSLGTRSLGSALFSDPLIKRGSLQFARLSAGHPLINRIATTLGAERAQAPLYARRCLYRRKRGHLLVTEVFLPAIAGLSSQRETVKNNQ